MRDAKDAGVKLEEAVLHRVAATALRLGGDADSASWFLGRAREMLAPLDARYELGKAAAEAAEQAKLAGDEPRAAEELDHAEKIFGDLGARWDLDRARGRRAPRTPPVATGAGAPLLAEILRDVGGADVERLLALALDRILAASGYERGFVLLLDNDGRPREHLRRHAARRAPLRSRRRRVLRHDCPPGRRRRPGRRGRRRLARRRSARSAHRSSRSACAASCARRCASAAA